MMIFGVNPEMSNIILGKLTMSKSGITKWDLKCSQMHPI